MSSRRTPLGPLLQGLTDRLERLRDTLAALREQLCDRVAAAVGAAVGETVVETVRRVLDRLGPASGPPSLPAPPWGREADLWAGREDDAYAPPLGDEVDPPWDLDPAALDPPPERPAGRWHQTAAVAAQLLAWGLRLLPGHRGLLAGLAAAAAVGIAGAVGAPLLPLLAALAAAAGVLSLSHTLTGGADALVAADTA